MHTEKLPYFHEKTECIGYIAYDDSVETKRSAVLVAPAWRGQDDFARQKAIELAQLGYVGFTTDIYGEGKYTRSNEEAPKLMAPFYLDRKLLQGRMQAAVQFLQTHPLVKQSEMGAMGFCFGGLAVYELLRTDTPVKAVVCFHGVFDSEREGQKAKTVPISPHASGNLLLLHGYDDPMVSGQDLKNVQEEMTKVGIDWQLHIFGHTMHAFTNPEAANPEKGTLYHERAAIRAWRLMQNFFGEIFQP